MKLQGTRSTWFIRSIVMPAQAGIQGGRGWIPTFAGMTEPSCQFVARIIPAHVFSKEARSSKNEVKRNLGLCLTTSELWARFRRAWESWVLLEIGVTLY